MGLGQTLFSNAYGTYSLGVDSPFLNYRNDTHTCYIYLSHTKKLESKRSDRPSQISLFLPIVSSSSMIRTFTRRLRPDWQSTRAQSTNFRRLLSDKVVNESVTVTGWITHKRKSKNTTFLDISDGSTYRPLQAVARTTPEG